LEEARLKLREAEVAAEQVKLALKAISLEERKATERFFALVRKATPQMRVVVERYGGDVSFNFDSNGRSVWVMALFGKGAPPLTLSFLRDGPSSRLRANGRKDGAPPSLKASGRRPLPVILRRRGSFAPSRRIRANGFVSVFMKCCT
jgi:hypothetical protein